MRKKICFVLAVLFCMNISLGCFGNNLSAKTFTLPTNRVVGSTFEIDASEWFNNVTANTTYSATLSLVPVNMDGPYLEMLLDASGNWPFVITATNPGTATLRFTLVVGLPAVVEDPLTDRGFSPSRQYETGETFTVPLTDLFNNLDLRTTFQTNRGTAADGSLTIPITQGGNLSVSVTATKPGSSATSNFTIIVPGGATSGVSHISVRGNSLAATNNNLQLGTEIFPASASGASVTWAVVGNPSNATVSNTGVFSASQAGKFFVTASAGGRTSSHFEVTVTTDGRPPRPNLRNWPTAPVVSGTPIFDDFTQSDVHNRWVGMSAGDTWGAGAKNVQNAMFSNNTALAAQMGVNSGGIMVIGSQGSFATTTNRTGGGFMSRQAFGPGLFEIRAKIMPRRGVLSAFWTYFGGAGRHSEIDFEFPASPSFANPRSSLKTWQAVRFDNNASSSGGFFPRNFQNSTGGGLNDGVWRTYAFEWRTGAGGNTGITWFVDGVETAFVNTGVPRNRAYYALGAWFPGAGNAAEVTYGNNWIGAENGISEFEESFMYVDWIRITQYTDPSESGHGGNDLWGGNRAPVNLQNNPIPQNNYVANGSFTRGTFASTGTDVQQRTTNSGWYGVTGDVRRSGSGQNAQIEMRSGSVITQRIQNQYTGYRFNLNIDASVTAGSGKLRAYVVYRNASSAEVGRSETLEFDMSDGRAVKTLPFQITGATADSIRLYIETEAGVTAVVHDVSMFLQR
jgi:hypothetical protein